MSATTVRQTAEWTVVDGDPRLDKLIAYGRRLGLPDPFRDSFDQADPRIEGAASSEPTREGQQ